MTTTLERIATALEVIALEFTRANQLASNKRLTSVKRSKTTRQKAADKLAHVPTTPLAEAAAARALKRATRNI